MKTTAKILTLLFLLNLALFANAVGTITALSGNASILRGSESITATLGAKLEQKDTIKTADATKVQVIFSDETIISIGKNSNFSIDEFLFEEGDAPSAKFGLLSGAMRTITGKIGKVAPDRFSVKTKTATIGIRGTNFSIFAGEDGSAKVFCTFGAISVTAQGDTTVVTQGFYIQVSPDGTRSEPIKFTPQELKEQQDESLSSAGDDSSNNEGSQTDADDTTALKTDSPVDSSNKEELDLVVEDITQNASDLAQAKIQDLIESKDVTRVMTGFGNHNWGYEGSVANQDEVTLKFTSNGETFSEAFIYDSYWSTPVWTYAISSTPTSYSSIDNFSYAITSISSEDSSITNINIKPTGNYFKAVSDFNVDDSMSWGDWGVSFEYTSGGSNYEVLRTGLWIAGEATPSSVIEGYKLNNITATYNGIYRANFFTGEKTVELVSGAATLSVDFGMSEVSLNIGVSDKFSAANMQGSIYNAKNEFSGGSLDGNFNGMFYGADGKSAGGKFVLDDGGGLPKAKGVYQVHTTGF